MPRKDREKWIKHYSSKHKILLVGEGDFSFAACLAQAFGSAVNITATSLDSIEELMMKHGTSAPANLVQLYQLGCTVIHNIDATSPTMNRHRRLRARLFDRIVYNFPHAGLFYPENNYDQIELHKDVVRGFMRNARDLLSDDGEVHVTHKTTHPFTMWGIEALAEEAGLELVEEVNFCRRDYPGYKNKRGYGRKSNKTFRVGECSTFIFAHSGVRSGIYSGWEECAPRVLGFKGSLYRSFWTEEEAIEAYNTYFQLGANNEGKFRGFSGSYGCSSDAVCECESSGSPKAKSILSSYADCECESGGSPKAKSILSSYADCEYESSGSPKAKSILSSESDADCECESSGSPKVKSILLGHGILVCGCCFCAGCKMFVFGCVAVLFLAFVGAFL